MDKHFVTRSEAARIVKLTRQAISHAVLHNRYHRLRGVRVDGHFYIELGELSRWAEARKVSPPRRSRKNRAVTA
jgi:hypothetical protein